MTVKEQQEFFNLVLEAADTGDKTKLAEWWRQHFLGYKWWLIRPTFTIVLRDDGRVEDYHSMTLPPTATPETPSADELMREIIGWCDE